MSMVPVPLVSFMPDPKKPKKNKYSHSHSSSYSGGQQPPPVYYGHQSHYSLSGSEKPNHYAIPPPIKTYNLVNTHTFSSKRLELQQSGQTILWVEKKMNSFMGSQEIRFRQGGESGTILATSRLRSSKQGCRVVLGGPDSKPKEQWCTVDRQGKEYVFQFGGRKFVWRRTKDEIASLVDVSYNEDQVLAVYERLKTAFSRHNVVRLDFMVELGRDLELMATAAILGVVEQVQWNPATQAGSQAASGGAIITGM